MVNNEKINVANTQPHATSPKILLTRRVITKGGMAYIPRTLCHWASEDDVEVLSKDVTLSREWVTKVNAGVDAVEILGQCLGKVEDTPRVLERHTLENIESI
ncbi:hypothetical protein H5410_022804 [Solanum commersonii]|uniref:Uncharacterized protein n=1 Tax=Solanum commersonii TaxID=4109 RepID=A0A9J5ZF27_SOLCO|nr:hypothetical protein H5410_022804 [Solanum commersonii]